MAVVCAVGTVNADFTMCLEGALEPGGDLIARRLLRTSGGRGQHAGEDAAAGDHRLAAIVSKKQLRRAAAPTPGEES